MEKQERVERGAATIGFYAGMVEQRDEEYRTNLIDLLADLRHFADHQGIDFQHCLFLAQGHYEAEGGTT